MQEKFKKEVIYFALQTKGGIIKTKGQSMWPLIENGSKVEVKPVSINDITIGDIIVFRQNEELTIHRAVRIIKLFGKRFFLLKGDNSVYVEVIDEHKIIARVTKIFKNHLDYDTNLKKSIIKKPKIIFSIIYFLLLNLKRGLLGKKRYKLTSYLAFLYWKVARIFN